MRTLDQIYWDIDHDPPHVHRWENKNPYENPVSHKTGGMFCMDCEFEANWKVPRPEQVW